MSLKLSAGLRYTKIKLLTSTILIVKNRVRRNKTGFPGKGNVPSVSRNNLWREKLEH